MKMKKGFFSLLVMGLGSCATSPTPLPDAQSAAAQLYAKKCGACHSVPHPTRNTIAQWRHLMEVMKLRMAEQNVAALSMDEEQAILSYLEQHARK